MLKVFLWDTFAPFFGFSTSEEMIQDAENRVKNTIRSTQASIIAANNEEARANAKLQAMIDPNRTSDEPRPIVTKEMIKSLSVPLVRIRARQKTLNKNMQGFLKMQGMLEDYRLNMELYDVSSSVAFASSSVFGSLDKITKLSMDMERMSMNQAVLQEETGFAESPQEIEDEAEDFATRMYDHYIAGIEASKFVIKDTDDNDPPGNMPLKNTSIQTQAVDHP